MIEAFINENAPIYVITIVMVLYSNLKRDRLIIFLPYDGNVLLI